MAALDANSTVAAQVKATATENRMRDLWHRKKQLLSLHDLLTKNSTDIVRAVSADDEISRPDAQLVLAATLQEIRTHFDSLNLKQELKAEYHIKWGRSNEDRRACAPVAYISSRNFNLLHGALSAIAAATAAGSCCLIKLEANLQQTPVLLRKLLVKIHDPEAVGCVSSTPDASVLDQCLFVDQAGERDHAAPVKARFGALLSPPEPMAVAVVDRTADIPGAARELAQTRLLFAGKSAQAVDLVLVNEYVAERFAERLAVELGGSPGTKAEPSPGLSSRSSPSSSHQQGPGRGQKLFKVGGVSIIKIGSDQNIRTTKTAPGVLALSTTSSLDDAIDRLANQGAQLTTLYIFAKLNEARYLSQFISTGVTFVNHIPTNYLVGPAAPWGHAVSRCTRYTRAMFEHPSPQFVSSPEKEERKEPAQLLEDARRPLKPTGQPEGGAMGFFDVAVGIGALVYLLPGVALTFAVVGVAAYKTYGALRW